MRPSYAFCDALPSDISKGLEDDPFWKIAAGQQDAAWGRRLIAIAVYAGGYRPFVVYDLAERLAN